MRPDSEAWIEQRGAAAAANVVDDVIIAEVDSSASTSASLYTKTTINVVGTLSLKLQISPVETGDIWADSGVTITAGATADDIVLGSGTLSAVNKRMRVLLTSSPTTGAADVFLLAN